ncbi:2-C-methyl-D-erythritol 4-phosphate cytidylyltransferase [Bacteroidales bacterium OttesenSCG-928-L03]|nr:2-C-methyl-D-erythritol 4-phosphate cytidylyltransferase [Bacteroidales bacterium OttesenSCG-928-L03]
MKKLAIIVAGGIGSRFGDDIPKQFHLLKGKPVLAYSIAAFYNYDPTIEILVVLPREHFTYWEKLKMEYRINIPHKLVAGGPSRFHSVKGALDHVPSDAVVAIHDGVRPLVPVTVIENVYQQALEHKAAYPVVPVVDTLRMMNRSKMKSKIVNREDFMLVQTPQAFRSSILLKAYEQDYSKDFTDDVSVVENDRLVPAVMVEGSPENIKITRPFDLALAETILKCKT